MNFSTHFNQDPLIQGLRNRSKEWYQRYQSSLFAWHFQDLLETCCCRKPCKTCGGFWTLKCLSFISSSLGVKRIIQLTCLCSITCWQSWLKRTSTQQMRFMKVRLTLPRKPLRFNISKYWGMKELTLSLWQGQFWSTFWFRWYRIFHSSYCSNWLTDSKKWAVWENLAARFNRSVSQQRSFLCSSPAILK